MSSFSWNIRRCMSLMTSKAMLCTSSRVSGRVLEALDVAVDAQHRRLAARQVHVGCAFFDCKRQQLCDVHSFPLPAP